MELEPSGVKVEKEMTVVTLPYMANSTNRQNVIHDIILLSKRILVILLCTGNGNTNIIRVVGHCDRRKNGNFIENLRQNSFAITS